MNYIQIPANWFYFVLGIIFGIVFMICLAFIVSNRIEKKNQEKARRMFETLSRLENEPKPKGRPRKIDK